MATHCTRVLAAGAAAHAAPAAGPRARSLEEFQNVVTDSEPTFHIVPCGCDCWYCRECCTRKGYNLRAQLVDVLKTFTSILMLSLTIDPTLFPDARSAYLWVRERRAIGRTMQDLRRWGLVHTPRYAYVLEFQKDTQFPHFHIVVDASFIPHERLLESWDKHRPPSAGPALSGRPGFGYCWISKRDFASALHAGRYITKYLVKVPAQGFPKWVMDAGKDMRIPRYRCSRGLMGNPPTPHRPSTKTRVVTRRSYADRVAECGDTVNVLQDSIVVHPTTGEVVAERLLWRGRLATRIEALEPVGPGEPKPRRLSVAASTFAELLQLCSERIKAKVTVVAEAGARP